MLDLTIKAPDAGEARAIRRGPWVLVARKSQTLETDVWNFSALRHLPILPYKTKWTAVSLGAEPAINDPWAEYTKPPRPAVTADSFHVFPGPRYRGDELDWEKVCQEVKARTKIDITCLPCAKESTTYGIEMPPGLDLWWNQTMALHFPKGKGPATVEDLADKAYAGKLANQEYTSPLYDVPHRASIDKKARLFVHVDRQKWGVAPLPNVHSNATLCADEAPNPWHTSWGTPPVPLMEALESWIVFWGFSEWCSHITKGVFDWRWQWETQPKDRTIRFHNPEEALKRTRKALASYATDLPVFAKPAEVILYETTD